MNRKHVYLLFIASGLFLYSCGGNETKKDTNTTTNEPATTETPAADAGSSEKGLGKFKSVELTHPLDAGMIKTGETVYDVKCASCHKTTDEKLVGPGWKGVTDRRTPEWIMNFVTNTDEMLDTDPNAQAMLEVCMVRMPNQNLKDDEARAVLEFMRKNDGKN